MYLLVLAARGETQGAKQAGGRGSDRDELWEEYGHTEVRCRAVEAGGLQGFGNWDRNGKTACEVLKARLQRGENPWGAIAGC